MSSPASEKLECLPNSIQSRQSALDGKTGTTNLTQKVSPIYSSKDPFKTLYRTERQAHAASDESFASAMTKSTTSSSTSGFHLTSLTSSVHRKDSKDSQAPSNENNFNSITVQRVLALRRVQRAMQSAPNASAVRPESTTFSEEDLKCLTMEELHALQKRKQAVYTEIQPKSVIKVSMQAERSRKRLEPRDYQIELYERARRENTIAVLGTGTGKTLIACLLIKDILIQERINRATGMKVVSEDYIINLQKRICVFLVPLVHLVFQQGNVIEANTVARTKRMCSEVYGHPKTWEHWQTLLENEDVLIMTAQIFLSALSHSLITISQVSLMRIESDW